MERHYLVLALCPEDRCRRSTVVVPNLRNCFIAFPMVAGLRQPGFPVEVVYGAARIRVPGSKG